MTLLETLKERVDAAPRLNFQLEQDIGRALLPKPSGFYHAFTIAAVLNIVEAKLPGVDYRLGTCGPHIPGYFCEIAAWGVREECRPTQGLAVLSALLAALIKEERNA